MMNKYYFRANLRGQGEESDEMSEAIFAAGCDDATVGSRDGVAFALFARQAASLEQAVRSALSQLQAAGYPAKEIIMEADSLPLSNSAPVGQ